MTKEQLGQIILSSEKQMYATAWAILGNEQDYAAFVAGWNEEKLQTWNLDDVVPIRLENKKKSVVYTLEEL